MSDSPARIRRAVFDVLGADSWSHKDEIVVKVGAVQDLGGDRVEKGLGQLGLMVVYQQPDVMQLDLVPDVHRLLASLVLALEPGRGFAHAQVIKLDAFALGPLLAVPVGGLEAVFGAGRFGAEQPVMAVEAVHHGLGDVVGQRGVEALREHGGHPGVRLAAGCHEGSA